MGRMHACIYAGWFLAGVALAAQQDGVLGNAFGWARKAEAAGKAWL